VKLNGPAKFSFIIVQTPEIIDEDQAGARRAER
jgi:hypothetical protein